MKNYVLTTERCTLRRLSRDEAEDVWTAAHTPGFTDGMMWDPPEDKESMHVFTDESIIAWEKGERYVFIVVSKDDGRFIGRIETREHPELTGYVWELGYWIHPREQNNGYATESTIAVINFTFEELGADAVVSSHHDWNKASGKVLEKCGLKFVEFSNDKIKKHGKPVRSLHYRLDRNDWEQMSVLDSARTDKD